MDSFLDQIFLGNSIRNWGIALLIIIGCAGLARIIQAVVLVRIRHFSEKTTTTVDDFIIHAIQRSVMPFFYILSFYAGIHYLWLDPRIQKVLHIAILFVTVFFAARIITDLIAYSVQQYVISRSPDQPRAKQARGILLMINIVVWIIALIFLIDNLGYNITTIVTGLGIGGIAIALAAQTVLGDLFSYLSIFFDKPFEEGDFIIIDDKMGTVEYIGVKTTRLKALGGEQLILANSDLTKSRIQNYKRMETRRIVFSFGVTYDTPTEKLKKIPVIIKNIIQAQSDIQFDRSHFSGFGDFRLNFETVYIILSADYNLYMDKQQAIYLSIVDAFEKEKIQFAYPTQKLFVKNETNSVEKKTEYSPR